MSPDGRLDEKRIEALAAQFLAAIAKHYRAGPMSQDRCYEVLNALACAAGTCIAGTGYDPEAVEFFTDALLAQMGAV